jgi:hypothetical protein
MSPQQAKMSPVPTVAGRETSTLSQGWPPGTSGNLRARTRNTRCRTDSAHVRLAHARTYRPHASSLRLSLLEQHGLTVRPRQPIFKEARSATPSRPGGVSLATVWGPGVLTLCPRPLPLTLRPCVPT